MKKILLISLVFITLHSCVIDTCNEPVVGCTDQLAINYNSQATINDNNCDFSSDIVFYMDANSAIFLDQQNVSQLTFYVNSFNIGSQYNNNGFIFSLEDPGCNDPYFLTQTINWSMTQSSSIVWEAIDESGYVWYSSSEVINPNECLNIRLTTKMIKEFHNISH